MKYVIVTLLLSSSIFAQFNPGFDIEEYQELLLISAQTADDEAYAANFDKPQHQLIYRSEPIGLDNQWDLWYDELHNTAAISVRGTTLKAESWLLNFYAAMIPAAGEMTFEEEGRLVTLPYVYARDEKAAVHAGWALGCRMMLNDILRQTGRLIDSTGVEHIYIVGHSQGGAIAYLLTSQLRFMQEYEVFHPEVQFKTYCSAAPKPGNLYFAYEYESRIQNGWGFNVVNAADWVPEVPISIQTLNDFNPTNPFVHIDDMLEKRNLLERVGLWWVIRHLERPNERAQENYERFLGDYINREVEALVPGLVMPDYFPSNNYVRVGIQIVMKPDEAYYNEYPDSSEGVFTHHLIEPYLLLSDQLETPFYSSRDAYVGQEWRLISERNDEGEMIELSYYPGPIITFSMTGKIHGYIDDGETCYWDISYIHNDQRLTVYRDPQTFGECETDHPFIWHIRTCNRLEVRGNQLLLMKGDRIEMVFENARND